MVLPCDCTRCTQHFIPMSTQLNIETEEKAIPAIVVKSKQEPKRKREEIVAVKEPIVKKPKKYVSAKNLRKPKKDNPLNKLVSISPAPNNDEDNLKLMDQEFSELVMLYYMLRPALTAAMPTIQEHKVKEEENESNDNPFGFTVIKFNDGHTS